VLDGLASPHTRRAYSQALEEFFIWFQDEPGRQFHKATVQKYRVELQNKGLAPSSINVRLSAIRRLALEAADHGFHMSEQTNSIFADTSGPIMAKNSRKVFKVRSLPIHSSRVQPRST